MEWPCLHPCMQAGPRGALEPEGSDGFTVRSSITPQVQPPQTLYLPSSGIGEASSFTRLKQQPCVRVAWNSPQPRACSGTREGGNLWLLCPRVWLSQMGKSGSTEVWAQCPGWHSRPGCWSTAPALHPRLPPGNMLSLHQGGRNPPQASTIYVFHMEAICIQEQLCL